MIVCTNSEPAPPPFTDSFQPARNQIYTLIVDGDTYKTLARLWEHL